MAVQRSVRVCSCVENIWRMCGECNCVKIDVTMSRDVWLCSREMFIWKGDMYLYVKRCNYVEIEIFRKIFQDEVKEKFTIRKHVYFLIYPQIEKSSPQIRFFF